MNYMHTNPDWWSELSLYLMNKSRRNNSKPAQFAVPASVEFLVNPRYRIYIDNPSIYSKLMYSLKKKQIFFTPYLGTSSMISFVKYIDEYNYKQISSNDYVSINSIVSFPNNIPEIELKKGLRFAIEEGLPIHIDNKRIPRGIYKVIYTPETGPITLIDEDIVELQKTDGKVYVKFLPTQITS